MVAAVRIARSWWRQHPVWGWSIVATLTVALVVGAFVLPALADVTVLLPNGDNSLGWTVSPSGTGWQAVDDNRTNDDPPTSDTDTTYVYTAGANANMQFNMETVAVGTINSVTAYAVVRMDNTANDGFVWRYTTDQAGATWASSGTLVNPSTAYARYAFTVPAPTGGWTQTALDNLGLGLRSTASGGWDKVGGNNVQVRCTKFYVVIDYTPAVTVTVGNTVDPTTPTTVSPGDTNVAIDGFSLTSTSGGTVNTVTVTRGAGTASVDSVKIYLDSTVDGVLSPAEIAAGPVGSGAFGSAITINQSVSTATKNYLVAVDVSAGQSGDNTVTGTVTAATGAGITSFTYNDGASLSVTVQRTIVAVADGTSLSTPVDVSPGQAQVVLDAFTLSRSQGLKTPTVSTVTVTKTGAALTSALNIYSDINGNGLIDGTDASVGSGSFGAPITISQLINAAKSYLVVVTIDPAATNGTSVTGTVSAAGGTNVDLITYADTTSRTANVVAASVVVTVGDGAALGAANVSPGDANLVLDAFTLTSSAAGTVNTVTVTKTETGNADCTTVAIYSDANGNGLIDGADASIVSGAWDTALTINQSVSTTPLSYLVVAGVGASATDGATLTGRITVATGTGVNSFTYNDSSSRTVTVQHTIVAVGDGTSLGTPVTVSPGDANVVLDAFTLARAQGLKTPTVSTITVTKTGTAATSSLAIYSDANGNGLIDGADASVATGAFDAPITVNQLIDATKSYLVVATIDAVAADGSSITGRVTAATGSSLNSFTYGDSTSRTANVQHTIVAVGDGTSLTTPVTVSPGDANVVIDAFTLSKAQGPKTPTVTTVTVTKTGTAATSSLAIYADGNGNGVIDGADASVGSGSFGAPIAINQLIDATKSYLVVVTIDSGAADASSVTGTVTAAAGTSLDSFTYGDTTSRTLDVLHTIITVGDGVSLSSPLSVSPGEANVVLDSFTLAKAQGAKTPTVTTVTVTKTGDAATSSLAIYTDANGNGVLDVADTSVGSGTFGAAIGINQLIDATKSYLVVVTIDGTATDGQSVTGRITSATGSDLNSFAYNDTTSRTASVVGSDTEAPSVPTGITAVAGSSSPVIATISWSASTDNVGVTGYEVWKCDSVDGTYWVIPGGTTGAGTLTFNDTSGVTGQQYFYKVRARDAVPNWSALSSASEGVTATWSAPIAPHQSYSKSTLLCKVCHDPHIAAVGRDLLRSGETTTESGLCYTCHDGTSAGNVKTGGANSFGLTSGHEVEGVESGADLTNDCSSCHTPHRDYTTQMMLPKPVINGVTLGAEPNALCLACHNATNDWYGAGYPSSAAPSVDATGYPVAGTFPTSTGYVAYTDSALNAHLAIPAHSVEPTRVVGDCQYCHSSHRGVSDYDSLTAIFRPSTSSTLAQDQAQGDYATLCFQCHGTKAGGILPQPVAGATDIQQFATAASASAGHRIKTGGGLYPVGAPLPCYECHNPHGSARGNKTMISDALGGSLETTTATSPTPAEAAAVRQFCFACHTAAGDDSLTPDDVAYSWDSTTSAYVVVTSGAKVAGLARDAAIGANVVRLPATSGHYRDDTSSCYKCHGGNYASATGNNVHNPSGGISGGGQACYGCHSAYQPYMEDNLGPKQGGAERLTVYHHVLGTLGVDGDFAPSVTDDTTYNPAGGGLYCVTCHVDHNKFNATPGANLRTDPVNTPVTGTDTDYNAASFGGGLCTSCHFVTRTRASGNEPAAQPTHKIASAAYDSSAHQYKVTSEFGSGNTFRADCSKCHTDEQAKEFQTSANKFGTHYSTERSLLTALGGTVTDPMGETVCYGCHTGSGAGADGYGVRPDYGSGATDMTAIARSVEVQFGLTSKHPVVPSAGNSVECANCHDPHSVTSTNKVSNPQDTYTQAAYGTDAEKAAFCLTCHDGTPPSYTNGATLVPYSVTIAATDADKSAYAPKGHWSTVGAISAAEQVNCAECHDNHASNTVKLLGTYNAADGKSYIGTTEITANNNAVCSACHASASTNFPAVEAQRDSAGYYDTGTWPGNTVYNTAYVAATHSGSPHISAEATNGYGAGDCKNCHDVHGTANTYDEIVGTFDPTSVGDDEYSFCFSCHDGTKGADIRSLYPSTSGGGSLGTRSGHRVLSDTSALPGETLSLNDAVPCYDCHNPHGSASPYALQVGNVGDEAGDRFDVTNATPAVAAVEVRHFCFSCHVPSDVNEGWADTGAGAGWVGLTTETVEGITRTSASYRLKLPTLNDHTKANAGNCMDCHNSPHEPTGGVSNGGAECLTCHSDKSAMQTDNTVFHHVLDAANPDVAPAATNTYPTSEVDLACVSCHTDHNNFNAVKGSNLRANVSSNSGAAGSFTDTDFISGFGASNNYDDGVCLGCHYASRVKSTSQKVVAGAALNTPIVADDGFNASAHQYAINDVTKVGYDGIASGTFKANCSKCHDDEQDAGSKQDGTYKIGTHYSARQHLLAALGGTPDANGLLAEEHCYGCHTGTTAGNDAYGAQAMTQAARRVEASFALTSKHPVVAAGTEPNIDSVECESCHNAHTVQSTAGNRLSDPFNTYQLASYPAGTSAANVLARAQYCLNCHKGAALPSRTVDGTTYIPYTVRMATPGVDNKDDSAAGILSKGHWRASGSITAPVSCNDCHDNHGSQAPKLLGTFSAADGKNYIGATEITANNKVVCQACHNAADAQYAAGATRDASGYPIDGTWPGYTIYNADAHAGAAFNGGGTSSLPAMTSTGDCKVCHDVHGTTNTYDELRAVTTVPASTVSFDNNTFSLCFDCHDTNGPSTKKIATYYPSTNGGGGGAGTGHRIATTGGLLAKDDGVPCYDCHNPHGSAASYSLQVGAYGDTAGEIAYTNPATSPDNATLRQFCFLCHSSSDAQIWNPGTSAYAAVGTTLVEGLRRDGTILAGQTAPSGYTTNWLKLKVIAGSPDPHSSTATRSCYDCHGRDYSTGSSNNVHNPSGGVSKGGESCYGCHAYGSAMEDDTLPTTGATNGTYYHHILGGMIGGTYRDGDVAPNTGATIAYPNLTNATRTDVFCVSCHSDHNYFNSSGSRSGNLRTSVTAAGSSVTNTDFPGSGTYGVCVSCHDISVGKSTAGTEKKSDGRTASPSVAGADYDISAHDYAATSTIQSDSSTFNANCSKCHNDEQTKDWQNSTYKFGTHWSANQHILSALGGANADELQETHCYRCHSLSADAIGGTKKGTNGRDYYNVTNMTTVAGTEYVYRAFQLTSKHPVVATGGDSVECESCHNAHEVQTANDATHSRVSDPDNTYALMFYDTIDRQVLFCYRCHDGGALPTRTIDNTTYVPYSVTMSGASAAVDNKSDATMTSKGHWTTSGSIAAGERVSCAVCHDNHGSNYPKLLGTYDVATGTSKINGNTIAGNDKTVCGNTALGTGCHINASTGASATYTRSGSYPTEKTWPGMATYNADAHATSANMKGGVNSSLPSAPPAGDCKVCHDVHGTTNTYDELEDVAAAGTDSFTADTYALCFDCHDGNGPAARNIMQYYPASAGGNGTAGNAGHKIKTAGGTLAVDHALPCYDCHNPHGSGSSASLVVESMIAGTKTFIGDTATEIDLSTIAGVRLFCFTCHTDATGDGTNSTGTAYTNTITATDLVEGLSRNPAVDNNALKLSVFAEHQTTGYTKSCLDASCHGTLTSVSATNVHSPSSGAGGGPCNSCHGTSTSAAYIGTEKMVNDTTTYHHVLDGGDGQANLTGTDAVGCRSCHVDHPFATKAGNLKTTLADGTTATSTDEGICLGCHATARTRTNLLQKPASATNTTLPAISAYASTVHDYVVNSATAIGYGDSSAFQANCVKCHDDGATSSSKYQTGTYKVATHYSAESRIAYALGAVLAGTSTATEENLCYRCHTGATAGTDGYGINPNGTPMTAAARSIQSLFNDAAKPNKHPVATYSGRHTSDEGAAAGWNPASTRHSECEDCHNVHEATAGTTPWPSNQARRGSTPPAIAGATKGVWGVTLTNVAADGTWPGLGTAGAPTAPTTQYSRVNSSSYQWQLCLKCHSYWSYTTTPPNSTLNLQNQTGGKQTDVGADFNPMQLSYHPIFKPGLNQPGTGLNASWGTTGGGSAYRKWIDYDNDSVNDGATETNNNGLSNTFTDGWLTTSIVVCTDCHNNSDATGASGPHASANKWILSGVDVNVKSTLQDGSTVTNTSYASANFCINCHRVDVYGTNEKAGLVASAALLSRMDHGQMSSSCYNTGTFNSAALTWSSCLHCHGGRKTQASFQNPANTVVQNGAIHGTSMTYHPNAATYTGAANYMGQRFLNGASWSQHQKGTTTVGCYNFSKTDANLAADNYSACTKHVPSTYTVLQYSY